jgi:IS30 family transposase
MQDQMKYQQLQPEDRMTIASMTQQGCGVRAMARALGRSASTISREISRNSNMLSYGSHMAQLQCVARRQAGRAEAKLDARGVRWGIVVEFLKAKWSPQQIASTLAFVFPNDPELQVSHETIYTAIYAQPRGELRRQLIACLRHGRSTRMPRTRGTDRRGQIPDMVSIHVRPPEVDDRVMPGHWEGDFIKGAGNKSSVGVLVERSSRLVLLAKMDDATAASALSGFSQKLNSRTGVAVYFCDPHSPWQRGTCENTNGLLRQYLPKGTDLSIYSQAQLDAIADSLNTRPRATHGFQSPLVVFARMLALTHPASTSTH